MISWSFSIVAGDSSLLVSKKRLDFDDSQLSLDVWGGSRNDDRPTDDDCKQDSGRSNSGVDPGDFGDGDVWITFSLVCWKYSNSRIIFSVRVR